MSQNTEYLQSIFAVAQTNLQGQPFANHGRTLRLVLQANIAAFALTVKFANQTGQNPLPIGAVSLAHCNEAGQLTPGTLAPVTVGGVLNFTLAPGQTILSDTIRFALQAGNYFALSIYYPTDEPVVSGNWVANDAQRSKPGNFSADESLPGPRLVSRLAHTVAMSDMTVPITSVREIIAHCETPGRVLGCFGDSITQQGNWTVPLEKLLRHTYPGQISLCNLGISGNRLLHNTPPAMGELFGKAGVARFADDLLSLSGLTHAIIEIGSNDLGHPGTHGAPETDLITPEEYATTMQALAGQLHARGVKTYAATIPPRALAKPYDAFRDELRKQMNHWLRSADCFDAILDFDEVLRRPDGQPGIREGCVLPDGLHPSPYGGLLLAKSIHLALFGGEPV
ncbi:GDSL-type esterase/lipase family protein [Ruminococcaceae bacterium OttesenSCG-928-A16]|nr:GDSL-type esterase/lipase family protein [Ruminococcaceae bacterium OttesenSCG-928-A16]